MTTTLTRPSLQTPAGNDVSQPAEWEIIADAKREEINRLLAPSLDGMNLPNRDAQRDGTKVPKQVLAPKDLELTEAYDAPELVIKLARGEIKAADVAQAFCKRAAVAHAMTNCLSEVMFEQALQRAKELDDHLETFGSPVGPLHGLPVSLKDQFRVEGTSASVGYVAWLKNKDTTDSESLLVKRLREAGAILYCKTNVPSSLMAIETNNNITGYTWNAYNRFLSSGGSSGGEGSLLAMKGSLVGLGSDIGASVRYPAGVNGVVGLKTSVGRLPYLGIANSMEGQEGVQSTIGPMARKLSDLRFMMQSLLATEPWLDDPKVINLPWKDDVQTKVREQAKTTGLTFGVLPNDGIVRPHPPVARVLDETIKRLEAKGHQVIEWAPPPHSEGFQMLFECLAADGGEELHDTFEASGEPVPTQVSVSYGEKRGTLDTRKDINGWWQLMTRRDDFRKRYLEYWNSTAQVTRTGRPVDALLLPLGPSASFGPNEGFYFGYTGIANLLDFSATLVPIDRVDAKKDAPVTDYEPISELDGNVWQTYNPELFDGAPVSVQIWTRRLEEEKALAVAEEVEACASVFEG